MGNYTYLYLSIYIDISGRCSTSFSTGVLRQNTEHLSLGFPQQVSRGPRVSLPALTFISLLTAAGNFDENIKEKKRKMKS